MWQRGARSGTVVFDRGDVCLPLYSPGPGLDQKSPADQSAVGVPAGAGRPVLGPIVEETPSGTNTLSDAALGSPLHSIARVPSSSSGVSSPGKGAGMGVMQLLESPDTPAAAPAAPAPPAPPPAPPSMGLCRPHQVYFVPSKPDESKVR